jgi:adenylate cyclase
MAKRERGSEDGTTLIDVTADWLMTQALADGDMESLVDGCCKRLVAAGIPLSRVYLAFRTLHPLFRALGLTWSRDSGIDKVGYLHSESASDAWQKSPFRYLFENDIPYLRRKLTGEEAVLDFPILEEVRELGATDYLAFVVPFGGTREAGGLGDGILGSWATDRPSGFSDRDIRSLLRIQRRLAVACKITIKEQIASNVLTAYLGPEAGRRVLGGQIRRGDAEAIHAVIWYSDLRDSTHMAETLDAETYIATLNAYFECTAGAVIAHGGDVLLLIGDAVVAIFPTRDCHEGECEACTAAWAAARDARERLGKLNDGRAERGLAPLDFGLGLHVGDVMYGNIGIPERLEFTVVGPAANEVARLQGLTKPLGRPIVASREFVRSLPLAWESLGRHELRGVGVPREVFAPPQEVIEPARVASKSG